MAMFCYQCQKSANCKGCTVKGVCGKTESLAKAQDLLIYITKVISIYSVRAGENGIVNKEVDTFIWVSIFYDFNNVFLVYPGYKILGKSKFFSYPTHYYEFIVFLHTSSPGWCWTFSNEFSASNTFIMITYHFKFFHLKCSNNSLLTVIYARFTFEIFSIFAIFWTL